MSEVKTMRNPIVFTTEQLHDCYNVQKMSLRQMAAHFHVEVKRIRQEMIGAGIEIRNRQQVGKVAAEKSMARTDYIPVGTRAKGKPHKKPKMYYPFTKEQLHDCYVNQRMTQSEIAKHFGISQKVVWSAMRSMNITRRIAAKREQNGDKNSTWKGGKVTNSVPKRHPIFKEPTGYKLVRAEGHPMAKKQGHYVYEHVLVALEAAGLETMPANHCAHHIDCDKQNNAPDNLVICTRSMHAAYHATLETLVKPLMERGIIGFDISEGYVVL